MALDLHRHDEYSSFDGFGKAQALAKLAKKKGLTALGISNHGNMNGVVEHWKACLAEDIKPVLGVEAYFQPKFNKKDPRRDSFHLCLFAENLEGYKNLNRIMTIANKEQRYYKALVDFALLEKYSEGVICTSGCIASFISQLIVKGRQDITEKAVKKFISIYGDNFYMELQPYKLDERSPDEKRLQERVNIELVRLAKKFDVKMVLTSDSHYGNELDYPTYMKMHEMNGHAEFAGDTYTERFMPGANDLVERFVKVHKKDFKDARKIAMKAMDGLQDIEGKVEMDILGQLEIELPKVSNDSAKKLLREIKKGLKAKGLYNKEYIARCKEEYEVMIHHGFEDYFLIVQDYSRFAKRQFDMVDKETSTFWKKFITDNNYPREAIKMGPGRGSVCNSLVAYILDITEVDSLKFDIEFSRFMRMDKAKMPDIDLDFETDRRQEVIEYIIHKYPGKAAQICSYGLYKVDNLLNDLAKVCGVGNFDYDEKGKEKFVVDKLELKEIKEYISKRIIEDEFDYDAYKRENKCVVYNKVYDDIILHFSKMYKKVRFLGTHAAGVAVVGGDLLDYTSLEVRGSKDNKMISTAYNLNNLDEINVVKFDMLGLRTLSITKELEQMTNECFSYEWLEDPEIYDYFAQGKTDGIFQFEKTTAKGILTNIETNSIEDVIAASALNRPGPLSLKMPEQYAYNKVNGEFGSELWSEHTDKTYGTIVYQEQIQRICIDIGGLSYDDADKVVKFMKSTNMTDAQIKEREKHIVDLRTRFVAGCKRTKGMSKSQATDLFEKMLVYTFNLGHSTGYALISMQQMYYKVNHPEKFWYTTLKYANEHDLHRLKIEAVKDGNIILLPHVNYGSKFTIVDIEGENALAEGLTNIKSVGAVAALAIEKERNENGRFKNKADFMKRIEGKKVNVAVVKALEENGALLFKDAVYFDRVQKYNATLYMKGMK